MNLAFIENCYIDTILMYMLHSSFATNILNFIAIRVLSTVLSNYRFQILVYSLEYSYGQY